MGAYEEVVLPFLEQHKVTHKFIKSYVWGTGFELRELGKFLDKNPSEKLRYMTACKLEDNEKVLVVITNMRLLIFDTGWILKRNQIEVFLDNISDVVKARNLLFGCVSVKTPGELEFTLTSFWGKDTETFINELNRARTDLKYGSYNRPNQNQGRYQQQPNPNRPQQPTNQFYSASDDFENYFNSSKSFETPVRLENLDLRIQGLYRGGQLAKSRCDFDTTDIDEAYMQGFITKDEYDREYNLRLIQNQH